MTIWQKCSEIYHRYQPKGQIACTRKISLIQNYWPLKRYLRVVVLFIAKAVLKLFYSLLTIVIFYPSQIIGYNRLHSYAKQHLKNALLWKPITLQQAREALKAQPDILQLDKFSIEDITLLQQEAPQIAPRCHLSVAGELI